MSDEHKPALGAEFIKVWSSELGVVKAYFDTEYQQEWINLDSVAVCFTKTKEEIVKLLEDAIKSVPTFDPKKPLPRVKWISTNGTEVIPYDYLWRVNWLINS